MSDEFQQIRELHKRMDEMQQPVIYDLAKTKGWGWGRIIQICHQQWDKEMGFEHSRGWHLASVMVLLEDEAKKYPERAEKLMRLHDELADVLNKR